MAKLINIGIFTWAAAAVGLCVYVLSHPVV